jgi:hypothetical protein
MKYENRFGSSQEISFIKLPHFRNWEKGEKGEKGLNSSKIRLKRKAVM